ncbi:iron-siderophore ABC transporter substrate-binding protein [Cellulomonas fimi]|uniref:Periplasmic binding protein n=1 Tax=Cellulomonas fimi (strain ATCC 484 / DSM 20113 / JCM 1341 / CCUG 24087 / LMG 16345 / NBRC 15513 / NCIMB 8980 / NCTC 7547 / NRS-133) TaxID=590998 RepID=F4H4I1_CELFA|nr:iron-siderophore ABC transporter substrate-binding protein [Cellulomonas fimi]AEE47776.1 periplasmic binding protein [Cellulomonas fimi ATCC 484]NNH06687.1 iron-siderophore ABC transporter substrate-binding protein [Cellulomonas fimi]VEH36978.1 Iron(III)-hydroxamate-binding protein fhuD [Cellulomonas fimi]
MRNLRALPAAALAGTAALLLAACGTTEEAGAAEPSTSADVAGGPVTITDDRGEEVTLDAPATDVVSLEWGLTENLLTLGVTPVGQADVAGYNTWDTVVPLDASVADVGMRGEPSLDAIAALDADLVVTTTDLPEEVIAQIEEQVPVIALRGSDASDPIGHMRRTVEVLGEATGTSDASEKALADFDAAVEDAKAELDEAGLAGARFTMADGWLSDGAVSVRMYTEGSYLGGVAALLGLENAWTGEGDPDYGLATTDVEGLTNLGEDVHFLYVANDTEGGDAFTEGLSGNAIWQQLPFVTAGDVHRLPDGIWMFGGPAAGEAWIDATVDALTK